MEKRYKSIPFLKPKLIGPRFDDHSVPLEILKDLASLEGMVVKVAIWLYMQDHHDRKRISKGFGQISLKLVALDKGSAEADIQLSVPETSRSKQIGLFVEQPESEEQQCAEEAIDLLLATMRIQTNGTADRKLPDKFLSAFNQLGRSLRDDEYIEFHTPRSNGSPVRYDKAIRKQILTSSQSGDYTDDVKLRGRISGYEKGEQTFNFEIMDGTKLMGISPGPIHAEMFQEAFDGYRNGSYVLIQGVATFDRKGALKKLDPIEHVSLLDDRDIGVQIDKLRNLADGYGLSLQNIDWLARAFERHWPDDLPKPWLGPTSEGAVEAEWLFDGMDASLEIDLEQKTAYWHLLNLTTEEFVERELDLTKAPEWDWLADQFKDQKGERERE